MYEDHRDNGCAGCITWLVGLLVFLWVLDWIGKLVGIE